MTDVGLGINSGFANARGMTWGYLAAQDAAAQSPGTFGQPSANEDCAYWPVPNTGSPHVPRTEEASPQQLEPNARLPGVPR